MGSDKKHTGDAQIANLRRRAEALRDEGAKVMGVSTELVLRLTRGCLAMQRAENVKAANGYPDAIAALRAAKEIMRYYHTGEDPGNLDECENPDNCGHCLAMRKINEVLGQ